MAASPDLTDYVDLTLYDVDAATIVARAIVAAATKLPGWVPREGNTEVVLIEAVAHEVMEAVYAINRVPGAVTIALLRLFGIERSDGVAPVATVQFTVIVSLADQTIEAGTVVRLDVGGEYGSINFSTDAELVIAAGLTTGTVAVTGDRMVDVANGTPAATALVPVTSVYFMEAAELGTAVADGENPEDDTTFLNRGIQRLRRLSSVLVFPEHFEAAALEEGATRATALNKYDPAVGPAVGDNPGHVTVAVLGAGGALMSAPAKAALLLVLQGLAQVDLTVHVADPTITNVAVDATVVRLAGYTDQEVQDALDEALGAYLDPLIWAWGGTVYLNEVIALMDGVAGVDRVVEGTVTLNGVAASLAIAGVAPLADYNAAGSDFTITAP